MAHNLEFNKQKGTVSFATAKQSAWHGLGTVVDGVMTTAEAIEIANLDFEVKKEPVYVRLNDTDIIIPETFATVRQDTHSVLGTVGEKYTILQNRDAFTFFDPILEESEAFIETAGVLGQGERIFITAKLPEHIGIFGKHDPIDQYLLITSSHDGKTATTVMFTPVRVVCQNTLNIALKTKTPNRYTIKHTQNQLNRLHTAREVMGLQNQYRAEIEKIFSKLADAKASEADYEKVIVAGLADTPKMVKDYFNPLAKGSTRFKNNVNAVLKYSTENPTQTMSSTRDTLFGAYNAVTGYFQNEFDWKGDNNNKMKSIMDTNGRVNIKQQQALDMALSLMKN